MIEDSFLVWVYCITFNQSQYIVDTLDGFCKQQTTFPFVCYIIDDASTDGEREVIMNYLQKFFVFEKENNIICEENDDYIRYFAQHKANHNCYFDVYLLKYNHHSIQKPKMTYLREIDKIKYKAYCEGDDYWIDARKLQKEVEFLEENDDYAMVHTAYNRFNQVTGETLLMQNPEAYQTYNDNYKWGILTNEIMIGAPTVICRTSLYHKVIQEFADDFRNRPMSDVQTWFHFARLSKIQYLQDVTAVYRKNEGSLTSMNSIRRFSFLKRSFEVHYELAKKYEAPEWVCKKILSIFSGSLFNVGIDYSLYDELITYLKEYHPKKKSVTLLLKTIKSIPLLDKNKVKRVVSHLMKQ